MIIKIIYSKIITISIKLMIRQATAVVVDEENEIELLSD